jgi:hypothetical protein
MVGYSEVDAQQIVEEVKERNRYYRAILEVQAIIKNDSELQNDEKLAVILKKCENAIQGTKYK